MAQGIPRIAFDSVNSFDKHIDGEIQLERDDEPKLTSRGKESIGGDGVSIQYAQRYKEEIRRLKFKYISEGKRDQYFYWLDRFGLAGDTFRYYRDNTDLTRYLDMKIIGDNKTVDFKRWHPQVLEFELEVQARVIALSAAEQADRDGVTFP